MGGYATSDITAKAQPTDKTSHSRAHCRRLKRNAISWFSRHLPEHIVVAPRGQEVARRRHALHWSLVRRNRKVLHSNRENCLSTSAGSVWKYDSTHAPTKCGRLKRTLPSSACVLRPRICRKPSRIRTRSARSSQRKASPSYCLSFARSIPRLRAALFACLYHLTDAALRDVLRNVKVYSDGGCRQCYAILPSACRQPTLHQQMFQRKQDGPFTPFNLQLCIINHLVKCKLKTVE
eukprot:764181-Prorocentrum_minimum.AAC.4